jgi:hypothetical protein
VTWTVTIPTDGEPLVVEGDTLAEIRDAAEAQGYDVTDWHRLGLPVGAVATPS